MPPKRKPLDPCQISNETIQTLESFIVQHFGNEKKYTQFVDPQSLHQSGLADDIQLSCKVPRWTLVIDTAEKDYEHLVQRERSLGIWAVAKSMKRPPSVEYDKNFFAGDFAVLEYTEHEEDQDALDDDNDDGGTSNYSVPSGYRVLVDAERKTIDDLISSFSDGRRDAQRAEHANSSALKHIYIIEGNMDELTKVLPEDEASGKPNNRVRWFKSINTDLDYMSFAFNSPFCVRQINSHAELVQSLYNMVKCNVRSVMDQEHGIQKFVKHLISGKRTRIIDTPDAVWSGMLQAIPGVSPAAAAAIMSSKYPTFVSFARDIVAIDDGKSITRADMIEELSDVRVRSQTSSSSRSHTRLGKRGERIVNLVVPVVEDSDQDLDDDGDDDDDSNSECKPAIKSRTIDAHTLLQNRLWEDDLEMF